MMKATEFNAVIFFRPGAVMPLAYNVWIFHNFLAASLRRIAPKARIILMLPEGTQLPFGVTVDKVIYHGDPSQPLMIAEIDAWRHFVESADFDRLTLFLDPDILMQSCGGALWEDEYDIALTWRTDPEMHHGINAGVIGCRPQNKDAVIHFFRRLAETLATLPEADHGWYGDQEALCRLTGLTNPGLEPEERLVVEGTSVRLLPVQDFNYAPPVDKNGEPILEFSPVPAFVHFKGVRKKIMFNYASKFLGYVVKENPRYPGKKKIFPGRPQSK